MIRKTCFFLVLCSLLPAIATGNSITTDTQYANAVKPDTTNTVSDWLNTFFESIFEPDDSIAVPQPADTIDWDAEFHLTDPVDSAFSKQHQQPPANGVRVGCFCMDNTRQNDVGRGACGGRGGVRFWLYYVSGIDSVYSVPTERHQNHPQALTDIEIMQLDAHNPFRNTDDNKPGNAILPFGAIVQLLTVVVLCATVLKIVQQLIK